MYGQGEGFGLFSRNRTIGMEQDFFSSLSNDYYSLTLSDGNHWAFGGAENAAELVIKFSQIIRLEKCAIEQLHKNKASRLIFWKTPDEKTNLFRQEIALPFLRNDTKWERWDGMTVRLWFHKQSPDVICEIFTTDNELKYQHMWDALQPIYQKSLNSGGLPLHAGLVEFEGKAYLLPGPGDTGKSTCCRRIPSSWRPLCDDESLIVVGPCGTFRAHAFPTWSDFILRQLDSSWDVQHSAPLDGIFFLEQARDDDILPLRVPEAAALINRSALQVWNKFLLRSDEPNKRNFRLRLFDNACEMARRVPCHLLHVSLTGRFWEKMERVIEARGRAETCHGHLA